MIKRDEMDRDRFCRTFSHLHASGDLLTEVLEMTTRNDDKARTHTPRRILVLDGGRVAQMGTHEELIAQEGIYRSIYEIQMNSDDRELLEQAESFPLKGGVENGL